MLGNQLQKKSSVRVPGNFFFDMVYILNKLQTKLFGDIGDLFKIIGYFHMSENDNAVYIIDPVAFVLHAFIVNAERFMAKTNSK